MLLNQDATRDNRLDSGDSSSTARLLQAAYKRSLPTERTEQWVERYGTEFDLVVFAMG
jgi:hypothetical protein